MTDLGDLIWEKKFRRVWQTMGLFITILLLKQQLQCRNDVFYTLAGVGRQRLPTHAMWIFIRKVAL